MRIVKMIYMNDEPHEVTVRIKDLRYDPCEGHGDIYTTLKPAEFREFEVHMPRASILYLKKWPKMVMLSYFEQSAPPIDDQRRGQLLSGVVV